MPGYFSNYIRNAREKRLRQSVRNPAHQSRASHVGPPDQDEMGSNDDLDYLSMVDVRPRKKEDKSYFSGFEHKLHVLHEARSNAFKIVEDLHKEKKKSSRQSTFGGSSHGSHVKITDFFGDNLSALCDMTNEELEEFEKERDHDSQFRYMKHLVDRSLMTKLPGAMEMVDSDAVFTSVSDRLTLKAWLLDYEALQQRQLWSVDHDREGVTADVLASFLTTHKTGAALTNKRLIVEEDPLGDPELSGRVQHHLHTLSKTSELEDELDGMGKKMRDISARIMARHEELDEKLKNIEMYQQRKHEMTLSEKIEELKSKLSDPDFKDSVEASRKLVIGQVLVSLDKAKEVVQKKQKDIVYKQKYLKELKIRVDELRHQMEMKTRRMFNQKEEEEKKRETLKNELTDFIFLSSFFLKEIDQASHAQCDKAKSVAREISVKLLDADEKGHSVALFSAVADRFSTKYKTDARRRSTVFTEPATVQTSKTISAVIQSSHATAFAIRAVQQAKDSLRQPLILNKKDICERQSRLPRTADLWPEFIRTTSKAIQAACEEFVPVINYWYSVQVEENNVDRTMFEGATTALVNIFDLLHPVLYVDLKALVDDELTKMTDRSQSSRQKKR